MKFNIDIGIYNINRSNPTLMDDILYIALSQAFNYWYSTNQRLGCKGDNLSQVFFVLIFNALSVLCLPCGTCVKLVKLGAHMAPGFLKIICTFT